MKKGKVINFRVDRIAATPMILTEQALPMPDDFDLENFTKEVFFMYSRNEVIVDLRCDNSLMKTMIDRFGEDVKTLAYDMTSFRLITEVSASPTFFGWVFGFGGKVQILAPQEVKEQYHKMIFQASQDTIEDIKTTDVKSSDKEDIQEVLDFVNSLIDSGKDFTDAEDKQLSDIKNNAESLLKQISDTEAEAKDLTDKVSAYEEAKVTSDDKQTIKDLVSDIDVLLNGDNLTEAEKNTLGEVKADAEALIKKIDDAAAANDTDNTEKVKDITSDNVTTDDKADLEKAKDDLEKALEDYKDNLTEDEKKAIEDEIDRIDKALEVIEKVEKVEDTINKLPNTITKNDADAIKAAEDAYNALSKYEQSIVDKDTKKKLDNAIAALENLNKPVTSPSTGDNTNIWMWFAVLFVSGMGLFGTIVYDRKKKQAK